MMKTDAITRILGFALMVMSVSCSGSVDGEVFDIPRMEGITIDGTGEDWGSDGFRVEFLTNPEGRALPADDFDAKFRLGWNDEGLLVLASVSDDRASEHDHMDRLWQRDCVELFIAESAASGNRYQIVVAPGADPSFDGRRMRIYDHRDDEFRGGDLSAQSASSVQDGSYTVETLLPWSNLGISGAEGTRFAFQFVANDDDGDRDGLRVAWYPSMRSHEDSRMMYPIRLSDDAGDPILCVIHRYSVEDSGIVLVRGSTSLMGSEVVVASNGKIVGTGIVGSQDDRGGVEIKIPADNNGMIPGVSVNVAGSAKRFESTPAMHTILNRFYEALGGTEAISAVQARILGGYYEDNLPYMHPPRRAYPMKAYADAGGRYRIEIFEPGNKTAVGYDGSIHWIKGNDSVQRLNKPYLADRWLCPDTPIVIGEQFSDMRLTGKIIRRGIPYYRIEGKTVNGDWTELLFDIETGLLRIMGFNEFKEYRAVGNVLVPHRIEFSRKGGFSAWVFTDIADTGSLDPSLFTMPDPADVFPAVYKGIDNERVLPLLKDLPFVHGGMNIPCTDGRLLYDLIVQNDYTRGLEIGTSNGYSTLWCALAFRKTGGSIITMEIDEPSAREAEENFIKAGLNDIIDLRIGDAFAAIPEISGEFDFIFLDAWKPDYIRFFELLKDRIRPGGAFAAHNVTSHARNMRGFIDAVKNEEGFTTSFHEVSDAGVSVSIRHP